MLNHNRNNFIERRQISDAHFQMLPSRERKSKLGNELMGLCCYGLHRQKEPGDLGGRRQHQGAQADSAQLGTQYQASVEDTWSLEES